MANFNLDQNEKNRILEMYGKNNLRENSDMIQENDFEKVLSKKESIIKCFSDHEFGFSDVCFENEERFKRCISNYVVKLSIRGMFKSMITHTLIVGCLINNGCDFLVQIMAKALKNKK